MSSHDTRLATGTGGSEHASGQSTSHSMCADRRPIMLRVQTDLLLADDARTPEMISEYEATLMALINDIDTQTALIIANKISHITEISAVVQNALNMRLGIVPKQTSAAQTHTQINEHFKDVVRDAHTTQSMHRAPASSYANIETDRKLAANQNIILSQDEYAILLKRARTDRKTGTLLLKRTDIKNADKAPLYHLGDKKQRVDIRKDIEQLDRESMRRLALPALNEEKLEQLVDHARARDADAFNTRLSALIHFSLSRIETIREDESCNLLALAINIAGCSRDQASAIFLSQNEYVSHSYERVTTLVSEMESMSRACAMRILSAVLERELPYASAQLGAPPVVKNKTTRFGSAYIIRDPELPLSAKLL